VQGVVLYKKEEGMSRRTLADKVQSALEANMSPTGITKVCRGGTSPFNGRSVFKISNGTPGQVLVQVGEPGGIRKIHIYTKNCADTMAFVRQYAESEHIPVR